MRNPMFLGALGAAMALSGVAHAQQSWQYQRGHVTIQFDQGALRKAGIVLTDVIGADVTRAISNPGLSWPINTRTSTFDLTMGGREGLEAGPGQLDADGGFALRHGNDLTGFRDFGIHLKKESGPIDLNVVGYNFPNYSRVNLDTGSPIIRYDERLQSLQLVGYELRISPDLANAWEAPSLSGKVIGTMSITGDLRPVPRTQPDVSVRGGPENDIAMCRLYGFSVVPSSVETIGGIRYNAYSAATDSVNFGTHPVTWLSTSRPADVNHMHPTIGLNVFRKLATGELEQIGEGQLKHAFTALSQSVCGTCQSGAGGAALGIQCSDPYSASLNYTQSGLGPKIEVNPYTGIWNKAGSWYSTRPSGYTYSPTELRMKVADADVLPSAQATFFMEGYYMSGFANNGNYTTTNISLITQTVDSNKYNNFGWRQVAMAVSSTGVASASDMGSWTNNNEENTHPNRRPYITQWGDTRVTMQPNLVGEVITAVRVTPVSGDPGWFKYDYAVYNMDLDRQVKSFHVSVADSVNVRNITFRDIDKTATNEWTMTRANGDVSWEMQAGTPNPLIYGRLYNFRFEAQAAAVPSWVSSLMVKAGTFPELNSVLSGPPPSTQPVTGTITIPGWVGPVQPQVDLRLTPVDSGSLTNVNDVPVSHPSGAMSA
ncbi:MAG: hypothetical protein JNK63_09790, partial [Chthonomonas sp.]|nr:hypothetical protein [Chthonomonas sp.]